MRYCGTLILALTALSLAVDAVAAADPPQLVVVISLDQFPQEELVRFRPFFGKGGFELLLSRGAVFSMARYHHASALTGPGHAVILSGAYGHAHGIVSNSWYDRDRQKDVYCVEDSAARLVGAAGEGSSPRLFLTATFGDMLRIHSGFRSRVFSFSNKDRAAVLLGGRLANGAFWMVDSSFVTSTYYTDQLPAWAAAFNADGVINSYYGRIWEKTLSPAAYATLGTADDELFERDEDGSGRTFPHRIAGKDTVRITASFYPALVRSPFGAEVLTAIAERAVVAERLGRRGVTDLLCLSFSSTDYVGHAYGPHSHEMLDIVVHMDRILARFFGFLEKHVGLRNCIIALTSDHGVGPVPEFISRMAPGGGDLRISRIPVTDSCTAALSRRWGTPVQTAWIERVIDRNIYFSHRDLRRWNATADEAARVAAEALLRLPGVGGVLTREDLLSGHPGPFLKAAQLGFHPLRSGDLFYILQPFRLEGGAGGTSHGDPYSYNVHVPLVMMGAGIAPGWYHGEASPADLAPTLSALTGVELPPLCDGRVLTEALLTPPRRRSR